MMIEMCGCDVNDVGVILWNEIDCDVCEWLMIDDDVVCDCVLMWCVLCEMLYDCMAYDDMWWVEWLWVWNVL